MTNPLHFTTICLGFALLACVHVIAANDEPSTKNQEPGTRYLCLSRTSLKSRLGKSVALITVTLHATVRLSTHDYRLSRVR